MEQSSEIYLTEVLTKMRKNVHELEKSSPQAREEYIEILGQLIQLANPTFSHDIQSAINTIPLPDKWKTGPAAAVLRGFLGDFHVAIAVERQSRVNYGTYFALVQEIEKLRTEVPTASAHEDPQDTQQPPFWRRFFTSSKE